MTGREPQPNIAVMEAVGTAIPPGSWTIDPARSELGFSVRHLMVATVRGRFTAFEGGLRSDAHGLTQVEGVVHTTSLDTGEPKRDQRLLDPSFLDARDHPQMRFTSRHVESVRGGRFRVVGDLTIKDATGELALEAVVRNHPTDHDPLRIAARGELKRSDFGLSWRDVLERAGAVVSDRVRIALEVVAVSPLESAVARGGAAAFETG
jgi:polyisoprenoid-binding protein YceI